ncbi:unnamed protein product [Rotaria socialis]|uniref:Uncharacterized protein n=1 Tax=Rotaria socialis TaxID=392032 RepID=A0A820KSP6_9BILA|nr:unnamed protein product [Rotaria socialis]
MEHIGSISVEGMYAKPIIDMLMIQGNLRYGYGATTFHETFNCGCEVENNFITFRDYLRTHSDIHDTYNEYEKSLITNNYHLIIKEYESRQDPFFNGLLNKTVEW